MDRLIEMYNSFMDWYTNLWYDTLGDTGVQIISGIMGLVFVAIVAIGCVGLVKRIVDR